MKTAFFQSEVLEEIKRHLQSGDLPLKRLAKIAGAALALSDTRPDQLENGAILPFLQDHPDCRVRLTKTIEQEDETAREAAVQEIRMLIVKKRRQ